MSDQPLVSIILPTFNRANVVGRSIQSVLSQTYRHFELIIVDDGSNDTTPDVVGSFDDGRIRYIRLAQNQGSSAARNHGLDAATGDIITFQDSDDRWLDGKLTADVAALTAAGGRVGVCVCSHRHIKGGKTRTVSRPPGEVSGDEIIRRLLMGDAYSTQTLAVRKTAMDSIDGFDVTLPRRQDWELCLRLAQKWSFVFVSDVQVIIEHSSDSLTSDPWTFIEATGKIRARHPHLFEKHRPGYSIQLYNAGKYLALAGHGKDGLDYATRALGVDPLNWRAYVLIPAILTRSVPLLRRFRA
ncbi:MAG: glycosyltransferase family 2 protein [Candidatus Latescibacterota bacterium]|nr:MAG: glycosyltransferase family 2 protein [Candidatus Latescibacterota bacterium]